MFCLTYFVIFGKKDFFFGKKRLKEIEEQAPPDRIRYCDFTNICDFRKSQKFRRFLDFIYFCFSNGDAVIKNVKKVESR